MKKFLSLSLVCAMILGLCFGVCSCSFYFRAKTWSDKELKKILSNDIGCDVDNIEILERENVVKTSTNTTWRCRVKNNVNNIEFICYTESYNGAGDEIVNTVSCNYYYNILSAEQKTKVDEIINGCGFIVVKQEKPFELKTDVDDVAANCYDINITNMGDIDNVIKVATDILSNFTVNIRNTSDKNNSIVLPECNIVCAHPDGTYSNICSVTAHNVDVLSTDRSTYIDTMISYYLTNTYTFSYNKELFGAKPVKIVSDEDNIKEDEVLFNPENGMYYVKTDWVRNFVTTYKGDKFIIEGKTDSNITFSCNNMKYVLSTDNKIIVNNKLDESMTTTIGDVNYISVNTFISMFSKQFVFSFSPEIKTDDIIVTVSFSEKN